MTGTATHERSDLTNVRTRLAGARQGLLADTIVALVRLFTRSRAALRGVASRFGRVLTGVGWGTALVVAAAFPAGYILDWTEAVVIAWTGLAVLVIAALTLLGRTAYDIGMTPSTVRVVVGEPAAVQIIVANPTRRRLAGVRIELPLGRDVVEFGVPSQAAGAGVQQNVPIPTDRRGVITLGPVRTVRADPLGVFRREQGWAQAIEICVHPRTIAIPSMGTGLIRDLEGTPTRDLTRSDVAFHALREYAEGDERRHIHWKSTAKTGNFMVRQFEQTRRSHLLVALSRARADFADDEEFELAVSVTGSMGVRAIRDSRTVSVVASGQTMDFAKRAADAVNTLVTVSPARLLDDLARVEASDSALTLTKLARVGADGISGMSMVFLVCGSAVTAGRLRQASLIFPAGVEVIGVICSPQAPPRLRSLGSLTVLTVGNLQDLQKMLARSRTV